MKTSEKEVWKAHSGELAWPTIILALVVVAGHAALWWASLAGLLPRAAIVGLSTLTAYLAFTVMHEAVHGNIHGNHPKARSLSDALGWLAGALLFAPLPAFRVLHLRHHSHTNHPEKDPDYFVRGRGLTAVARCFGILPHYYAFFLFGDASRTTGGKRERRKVLFGIAFFVALAIALASIGYLEEVLFVWLLPAWLATGVLAFLFDWLPHHPHDVQGRYVDTRAIAFTGLGIPTLGQNLHIVHHLFPRVPFYRYHQVFRILRDDLRAKGTPIVEPHRSGDPAEA